MDGIDGARARRNPGGRNSSGAETHSKVRDGRSRALLERGDVVRVVATGFAVRPAELERGLATLATMGYEVRVGSHVRAQHGYFAGDDDARFEDLAAALEDADARAIWFARGGYGTARLLPRIDWRRFARAPKLLIGYSDLTALFAPAVERGARCFYGPMVGELGDRNAWHRPSLMRLIAGERLRLPLRGSDVILGGRARGRLVGGNLTVLTHLAGTPYAPRLEGSILFLEEIGEESYRIDRCLTHLASAGAFEGLRGVVLGSFIVPPRRRFPKDRPWLDAVREIFGPLRIPVVSGIPAGHVRGKKTLPLGGTAEIDTVAREVHVAP